MVDTLKNLHFDSNYLFGDLDDCLCFGYVFPLNDASVDLDDCPHGLHMHYLCYTSCECSGCGALVYLVSAISIVTLVTITITMVIIMFIVTVLSVSIIPMAISLYIIY